MRNPQLVLERLTTVVHHLQRVHVTLRQQQSDVDAALAAALELGGLLKEGPAPRPAAAKTTEHLDLAALRAGLSFSALSYLASIPEPRLRALVAGDPPSQTEVVSLRDVLPHWRPAEGGAR